jgi:uncharacterized protein (DUF362 family)
MFDFLRRAREAPAKEQPPGLEQFNSANVASAVRKECLTHPATILPAAGSLVTLGWTVFIAASPASVALTIGCLFVSGSALDLELRRQWRKSGQRALCSTDGRQEIGKAV